MGHKKGHPTFFALLSCGNFGEPTWLIQLAETPIKNYAKVAVSRFSLQKKQVDFKTCQNCWNQTSYFFGKPCEGFFKCFFKARAIYSRFQFLLLLCVAFSQRGIFQIRPQGCLNNDLSQGWLSQSKLVDSFCKVHLCCFKKRMQPNACFLWTTTYYARNDEFSPLIGCLHSSHMC